MEATLPKAASRPATSLTRARQVSYTRQQVRLITKFRLLHTKLRPNLPYRLLYRVLLSWRHNQLHHLPRKLILLEKFSVNCKLGLLRFLINWKMGITEALSSWLHLCGQRSPSPAYNYHWLVQYRLCILGLILLCWLLLSRPD